MIFVFNNRGELALQLRAAQDDSYPFHWDFSAAGGIEENEDPKKAAERELREELDINGDMKFLAEETYENDSTQAHLFIYRIKHNGPFTPDPKEVERVQFFSIEQIDDMIAAGEKFHPEFKLLWDKGIIAAVM